VDTFGEQCVAGVHAATTIGGARTVARSCIALIRQGADKRNGPISALMGLQVDLMTASSAAGAHNSAKFEAALSVVREACDSGYLLAGGR
jgi:hypothetical protein